jgi:flagellar protein FlgJ
MQPDDFIAQIAPAAQALYPSTGVFPSVVVAQAIFESGWGSSELTIRANNLFGIKADPAWNGQTISLPTIEYENGVAVTVSANWRSYLTWQASILDHTNFLHDNERYAGLWVLATPQEFCQGLQDAGYSTNPNYAQMLIDEISARNLTQYDTVAS